MLIIRYLFKYNILSYYDTMRIPPNNFPNLSINATFCFKRYDKYILAWYHELLTRNILCAFNVTRKCHSLINIDEMPNLS